MEVLADPTRLRLLRLLERHELGVAELCDVLQLPQSTVSRHLKVLADQGWIAEPRRRARRTSIAWTSATRDAGGAPAVARSRASRRTAGRRSRRTSCASTPPARRAPAAARRFFAGAAGQWDRLRDELYGTALHAVRRCLGLLPADWVVADLGCGTGQVAAALAPHVRRVHRRRPVRGHAQGGAPADGRARNVELRQGQPRSAAHRGRRVRRRAARPGPHLRRGAGGACCAEMARILRPGRPRRGRRPAAPRPRGLPRARWGSCASASSARRWKTLMTAAGFGAAACRPIPPDAGRQGPALLTASAARAIRRRRHRRHREKGERR